MPTPPKKSPISERNAHLFTLVVIIVGLAGVAGLELTDRPRDPLAGWYLLIWPFIAVTGDVGYAVSGDPERRGFVRRGVLSIIGLHLLLAGLQGAVYLLPDPAYDAWLAAQPPDEAHASGVQPWLVAVIHMVGLLFAPVIGFLLRNIRRVWAADAQEQPER